MSMFILEFIPIQGNINSFSSQDHKLKVVAKYLFKSIALGNV